MKAQGYEGQLKIHERERLSDKPFGYVSSKAKFRYDIEKVPFYHVPDLTGFKLKAYVPHTTPKIDPEKKVVVQHHLTDEMLAKIEEQVEAAMKGNL